MAFNDSYVEKYIDFKECVVKNTNHDLAIIQFKDKKTPENAHIFEIPKEYPLKEYSIDDNISGIFEGGKGGACCHQLCWPRRHAELQLRSKIKYLRRYLNK